MAIRTFLDPYGGAPSMIDKLIGTAYPKVAAVAENLDAINYCVHNMEALIAVASMGEVERTGYVTGTAPAVGGSATLNMPTGVTAAKLRGFTVLLMDSLGVGYLPGSHYTARIIGNALRIDLDEAAPSSMAGGGIRWHMTYTA